MLNPFDLFDKIYCINLDSRPDRWEKVGSEFSRICIDDLVTRVSGVIFNEFEDKRRNACVGNHFSHAKCFFHAEGNSFDSILIFEDDVEFFYNKNLTWNYLTKTLEQLPTNWDMLYLGINLDRWQATQVSENLARLSGGFSTHAYAVRRNLFEFLYQINSNSNILHNDVFYAEVIHPNYNCYVTVPLLCGQSDSYSDIEGKVMSSNQMFLERFKNGLV